MISDAHLSRDWDITKNVPVNFEDISTHTKKSFWWTCPSGHSYQVSPYTRIRSNGCKYCNKAEISTKVKLGRLNKGLSKRLSDVASPDIMAEWDYKLNSIKPSDIASGSHTKVHWVCPKGHSWLTSPKSRTGRGDGCPICAKENIGERVRKAKLKITGSIGVNNPELLSEWDYAKNTQDPFEVNSKSNKKAFWKCKFNHSWEAIIGNRTGLKSNCPFCSSQTSRLEIFILCELRSIFKAVEWRTKFDGLEADIYIPECSVVIEVDGEYWHRNKVERDLLKNDYFNKKNIDLIRLRAQGLPSLDGDCIIFAKKDDEFSLMIKLVNLLITKAKNNKLHNYLIMNAPQNQAAFNEMLSRLPAPPEGDSLASTHSAVAAEWNYEKNSPLTPDLFTAGSEQAFWWTCILGHSWQATIKNRTKRNSGCPDCWKLIHSGNKLRSFANERGSLEALYPDISQLWDLDANKNILPSGISASSTKKCSFKCNLGHIFLSTPQSLVKSKFSNNCPICEDLNKSLATLRPDLLSEWDYDKNAPMQPSDVRVKSGKKVWWKCEANGHSYQSSVSARTDKRIVYGCGICWGLKRKNREFTSVIARDNSKMNEWRPKLIVMWDHKKNPTNISSQDLTFSDKAAYWWLCEKKHSFQAAVSDIVRNKKRCHECGTLKAMEKGNATRLAKNGSLQDNYPAVAARWHPHKNAPLLPSQISSFTKKNIWWKCINGHEFQKKPIDIVTLMKRGSGFFCPICRIKK